MFASINDGACLQYFVCREINVKLVLGVELVTQVGRGRMDASFNGLGGGIYPSP